MKKIFVYSVLAITLSGCATDSGQMAGVLAKVGTPPAVNDNRKLPDQVSKMLAFANRETATINACIAAQQKAGFKPIGQRKELTLLVPAAKGNDAYKVTVAGLAAFQVPPDALAKQSPELVKMLSTFAVYVSKRSDLSTVVITATNKSDVNFIKDTMERAAPNVEVTTVVKPGDVPLISFVSTGPSVRKL